MPSPPAASSPQSAREGRTTSPPPPPRPSPSQREGLPRHPPAAPPSRSRGRGRRRGLPLTLYLYLASEVLVNFAVALLAIVLIYVSVVAFQLVRDGIRLGFVWPHLFRTLPYPLFFAVPLAVLVGVTLGLGRLGSDQEMSALRAQGVSHRQIALPLGILGALFAALTFYLTGWVLPGVHYEHANLRETILGQLGDLGSGSNRTILLPGNSSLWVKRYEGPRLWGLVLDIAVGGRQELLPEISKAAGETLGRRLLAQAGKARLMARESELEVAPDRSRVILRMAGVVLLIPEEVSGARGRDVFHQRVSIDKLHLPLAFARRGESARDMDSPELWRWVGALRKGIRAVEEEIAAARKREPSGLAAAAAGEMPATVSALERELASLRRRKTRAETEYHGRLTFSLACLTFPLVAFPLVVLLENRARLIHFFLGNLVVVAVFFPLVMAGQIAADRGLWPPLAMAIPNLVLAAGGVLLFRAMLSR